MPAAKKLPGWDPSIVQIRDLTNPFCRLAIMMLGTWSLEPTLFPNFGLYIDSKQNPIDLQAADRVQNSGSVSVVLNTERATIIATVSGTATELWVDEEMIGLAAFSAQNVKLDVHTLIPRDEPYPEIVLSSNASIVLDPSGARISYTPLWIEGLGYRPQGEEESA